MSERANTKTSLQKISNMISGTGYSLDPKFPPIEVKEYTKKFGKFVSTDNVSFTISPGRIHGFIGPNGSGKTTTIKALIGAYKATKGELLINGKKAGTKAANRLIGYIPEKASFPPHLNSIQYLKSMAELSGIKAKVANKRAIEILKALKLEKQAKRKPITFSSGMQKKILLAQSLLTDPSILILDEPAANLDPKARRELFEQLIELRNQGKTILISSHILAELERFVDDITFIYYGEILFSGTVKQFNQKNSKIYIKTGDNKKLIEILNHKKIKFDGDEHTEVRIANTSKKVLNSILDELIKQNITIVSVRANDLLAAYETLATAAKEEKYGKQLMKRSFWRKFINKINKREGV